MSTVTFNYVLQLCLCVNIQIIMNAVHLQCVYTVGDAVWSKHTLTKSTWRLAMLNITRLSKSREIRHGSDWACCQCSFCSSQWNPKTPHYFTIVGWICVKCYRHDNPITTVNSEHKDGFMFTVVLFCEMMLDLDIIIKNNSIQFIVVLVICCF